MQNKLEKPKLKHNKKRNTAFLFEALTKELTKSVIYGDKEKQKVISLLLREHFKKASVLDAELNLYKQIYETKNFPKEYAEKLINEVVDQHEKLDEIQIFNEQSKLIAKVNKLLGIEVYNNFVPNYKTIATISQIFNKTVEPRKKVLLEQELLTHISSEEKENKAKLQTIDSLVFKRFIERFNETYDKTLLAEQKQLLSKYINFGEDSIELKLYLSEEIDRLKKEVANISNNDTIKENEDLRSKIDKINKSLRVLKIETVNEELIKKIMLMQELVSEVNS